MSERDVIERQKRRELRGSILRTARLVYGDEGRVTIGNCLRVAGKHIWREQQVAEEAHYLVEKGYLQRHDTKRDQRDEDPPVVYSLTAKGMDLINGDIADEAIEL
jgi:hypothetical protein